MPISSVIIVGAGISGLLAGTVLQKNGIQVTLIDKGRGVGGRLATRRMDERIFDHGAQYFTAHDSRFQKFIDELLELGIIRVWTREFHSGTANSFMSDNPRYIAPQGMTAVAKHFAKFLDVRTSEQVVFVSRNKHSWQVETESGLTLSADALILTPPLPQSLALLQTANFELDPIHREELQRITYQACFSLLVSMNETSQIPSPGGIWFTTDPKIKWIADNYMKGISPSPCITVQSSGEFALNFWETPDEEIANELLSAIKPYVNGSVLRYELKRWRYAFASTFYHAPYEILNSDPPLALAGDAFYAPRVEGGAISGISVAEALLKLP
ncbi:MAG: FAD-dependent oxidoreductase [Chloroherpetonaceae bacterium]|nr:FAD-dependent oxidoreductase [Chloroherpetonaceae bacterium]